VDAVSYQAVKAVLGHSRATGSARIVVFCLAEHARKDGTNAFLSITTLQHEGGFRSRSTVVNALRRAEELGEIERVGEKSRGTPVWRISLPLEDSTPLHPRADCNCAPCEKARDSAYSGPENGPVQESDQQEGVATATSPIGDVTGLIPDPTGPILDATGPVHVPEPVEPPREPPREPKRVFPISEEEKVVEAIETAEATLRDNPSKKNRERLQRHLAELRDELGTEAEISAMAGELLGVAA
jgi:hypothetical protein